MNTHGRSRNVDDMVNAGVTPLLGMEGEVVKMMRQVTEKCHR
jgi:hypothetical protein